MNIHRILHRLLLASALLATAAPGLAATDLLDRDGNLHSVRSTEDGSALIHFVQHADGTSSIREVNGTGDPLLDLSPDLALDPNGRSLALVWSREASGNFEVAIARFDEEVWSDPVLLSSSTEDDLLPQVRFGVAGIAVAVWMRQEGLVPTFHYRAVTRLLIPLGPTEPLTAPPVLLDLEHGGAITEPFPSDSEHFLFRTRYFGRDRLILFGLRDEPAPIPGRWLRLEFVMPKTTQGLDRHRSGWVAGKLLIRVMTDQGLLYTQQNDESSWTEYRMVNRPDLSMEAAELLIIQQMLQVLVEEVD
jgi:hypothetical protein